MTANNDPLLGMVIADRYILLERVAEGRSGVVYRAEHALLRTRVAVKLLHEQLSGDEQALQHYHQDLTSVARIESDHVARIVDFGRTEDARLFVAMEFLDGETLGSVVARENRLEEHRIVEILEQVGDALIEAHSLGLIHGTLRPKNVLLTRKRRRDVVKLLSFGLLRLVEDVSTALTAERGKASLLDAHFICPELVRGEVIDARGDVYSLAAVAYTMACGVPPFEGLDGLDVLRKQAELSPTPAREREPSLSDVFSTAVQRALARQPEERFPSVGAFLDAVTGRVSPEGSTQASPGANPEASEAAQTQVRSTTKRTTQPMAAQEDKVVGLPPAQDSEADESSPGVVRIEEPPTEEPLTEEFSIGEAPTVEAAIAEPSSGASPSSGESPSLGNSGTDAPEPDVHSTDGPVPVGSVPDGADSGASPEGPLEAPGLALGHPAVDDPRARTLMGVGVTVADVQRALEQRAAAGASAEAPLPADLESAATVVTANPAVEGDDVARLEPGAFTSETVVPETSGSRSRKSCSKTPVPEPSDLVAPDPVPTESGDWFAEGMAAEQALEASNSGTSLPAMYGEVDELDEVRPGPSPSLIIGGVVVLAMLVLAIVFFATRGGEDTQQERLTKRVLPAQLGTDEPASPEPEAPPLEDAGQAALAPSSDGGPTDGQPDAPTLALGKPDARVSADATPVAVADARAVPKKEIKQAVARTRPQRPPRRAATAKRDTPRRAPRAAAVKPKDSKAARRAEARQQVGLARAELRRGSYGQARELFQRALQLDPRSARAQGGLGEVHFELGDYVQSAKHLKRAVSLSPKTSRYRVMLGNVYFKQGRTNAAISQYRQALQINPKSAAARTGMQAAIRRLANEG